MTINYAKDLRHWDAEKLANKLKRNDAKLRKLGGNGNYSDVQVIYQGEMLGKNLYSVQVTLL